MTAGKKAAQSKTTQKSKKKQGKPTVTTQNWGAVAKPSRGAENVGRSFNPSNADGPRRAGASASKSVDDNSQRARDQLVRRLRRAERYDDSGHVLCERLDKWLRLLADPFNAAPVKCPVNYNPVPTFGSVLMRTTTTNLAMPIAAGGTTTLAFFGGHGESVTDNVGSMDGVSFHCAPQNITGFEYTIGPIAQAARPCAIGFWESNSFNKVSVLTSNGTVNALVPDNDLPFVAVHDDAHHTRWKLVGMSVRLENVTTLVDRGGSIASVQPGDNWGSLPQSGGTVDVQAFARYPTFTVHDGLSVEVSWIPRAESLAYWHTGDAAGLETNGYAAELLFFINGQAGGAEATQTYTMSVVQHWEISGANMRVLATPSVMQPADRNVVEPTLDVLRFTKPSAKSASSVGRLVAESVSPLVSRAAGAMVAKAKKVGGEMLAGLLT